MYCFRILVHNLFQILICVAGLGCVLILTSVLVNPHGSESVSAASLAAVTFFGIFLGGPAVALRTCSLLASFACVLFLISSQYESRIELVELSRSIHVYSLPVHQLVDDNVEPGRLNLVLHHLARGPGDSVLALAAVKHIVNSLNTFIKQTQSFVNAFHTIPGTPLLAASSAP